MKKLLLAAVLFAALSAEAARAQIPFVKGTAVDRPLSAIELDADSVSMTFSGDAAATRRQRAAKADVEVAFGSVEIVEARGWLESAFVTFKPYPAAQGYHVYVKGGDIADYQRLDASLVRNYGSYGRADAVGLRAADDYRLMVVPTDAAGAEIR